MKNLILLFTFVALNAFAESSKTPRCDLLSADLSTEDAIRKLKVDFQVEIKGPSLYTFDTQAESFRVSDARDAAFLAFLSVTPQLQADGKLPKPKTGKYGKNLYCMTEVLLQTPKSQLLALQKADHELTYDINTIRKWYGIELGLPNAYDDATRFPQGQRQLVEIAAPLCSGNSSTNWSPIGKGSFTVGLSSYLPERMLYTDEVMYHKGDLFKILVEDTELNKAIKERLAGSLAKGGCYDDAIFDHVKNFNLLPELVSEPTSKRFSLHCDPENGVDPISVDLLWAKQGNDAEEHLYFHTILQGKDLGMKRVKESAPDGSESTLFTAVDGTDSLWVTFKGNSTQTARSLSRFMIADRGHVLVSCKKKY